MSQAVNTRAASEQDSVFVLPPSQHEGPSSVNRRPGATVRAWSHYAPNQAFQFYGVVRRDEGQFGAEAITLPGVFAYGSTMVEALNRLKEAATAAIESYLAQGDAIPWQQDAPASLDTHDAAFAGWLQVHVA